MRNILNEKPEETLSGRLYSSVQFVDDADIRNKDVLNIGCGFGWCELNFLNRGVQQMTGIEISETDLKTAKANVVNEKIKFQVGSAIQLSFPDNSFDTVVSWEVIEHIPRNTENKMFAEVRRTLKVGGVFYLSTPHHTFVSDIFDPAWWLVGHRHYSQERLTSFAVQNGFSVEEVVIKGSWWTLLSILNMYISKWIFKRGLFFEELFANKENEEYLKKDGFLNIFIKFRKVA